MAVCVQNESQKDENSNVGIRKTSYAVGLGISSRFFLISSILLVKFNKIKILEARNCYSSESPEKESKVKKHMTNKR